MLSTAALATLGALLLALIMPLFFSKKRHFDPLNKHCYVGGASEGLGLALACILVQRGAHVTIVSRNQDKLDKALIELETHRQVEAQKISARACDLSDVDAAAQTLRSACEPFKGQAPDMVFACAGASLPGFFTRVGASEHLRAMHTNFASAIGTTHEAVRLMCEQERRGAKVVFTASILAMMGFAGYSTYAPSKYAIRGLADTLRNELQAHGIKVHLFMPATILSPSFFATEQKLKPEVTQRIEGPDEGLSPDAVAQQLIKGLERGDYAITYEPVGHMLRGSRGITPRSSPFLLEAFWGLAGTIAFPFWRVFVADKLAREAKW